MLIFNKKRLMFLALATFLPIGMFIMQNANNNIKNKNVVATMATPVTSRTIIIDARTWWRGWRSSKQQWSKRSSY